MAGFGCKLQAGYLCKFICCLLVLYRWHWWSNKRY